MIKGFLERQGKKGAQKLVLLLLAGVLLLLASSYLSGIGQTDDLILPSTLIEVGDASPSVPPQTAAAYLAQNLEEILSQIAGAGQVRVMLTIGTPYAHFAQNSQQNTSLTTEEDAEGGVRNVESINATTTYVMVRQSDGSEAPLALAHIAPSIEGVIIVAEGGGDVAVRDALTRAAQALLGTPSHRVQVFQMQ